MTDAKNISPNWQGSLPDHLGMTHTLVAKGHITGHFTVERHHMAPNGFLHAASIIALVDTACGFGSMTALPDGANGFTTIELKTNFLGTTRDGHVDCDARLVHGGRTTQVWDATATHRETGKVLALFRCTQMVLW